MIGLNGMQSIKPNKIIRQRFIAARSNSLVIETIQTQDNTKRQRLRLVELKGTWRANENNELVFDVSMRKGPPESYIFKGIWKLNKNQQIEYVSGDKNLFLVFKGYWDTLSNDRIVYLLEGSTTSRFEFKVQLESANLYPKKGQIKYRIGLGARKSRLTKDKILLILYGQWKFGRNLSLVFNMDYGQGRVKSINFGAEVTFGANKLILALNDESGERLGVTFTMTHKLLKTIDAEAFIRLKKIQKESRIEGGITIPF